MADPENTPKALAEQFFAAVDVTPEQRNPNLLQDLLGEIPEPLGIINRELVTRLGMIGEEPAAVFELTTLPGGDWGDCETIVLKVHEDSGIDVPHGYDDGHYKCQQAMCFRPERDLSGFKMAGWHADVHKSETILSQAEIMERLPQMLWLKARDMNLVTPLLEAETKEITTP